MTQQRIYPKVKLYYSIPEIIYLYSRGVQLKHKNWADYDIIEFDHTEHPDDFWPVFVFHAVNGSYNGVRHTIDLRNECSRHWYRESKFVVVSYLFPNN